MRFYLIKDVWRNISLYGHLSVSKLCFVLRKRPGSSLLFPVSGHFQLICLTLITTIWVDFTSVLRYASFVSPVFLDEVLDRLFGLGSGFTERYWNFCSKWITDGGERSFSNGRGRIVVFVRLFKESFAVWIEIRKGFFEITKETRSPHGLRRDQIYI